MKISLSTDSVTTSTADLVAIGVFEGKNMLTESHVAKVDKAMSGALAAIAKDEQFAGKSGTTLKVPARGRVKAKWFLLVGLGKKKDITPREARMAAIRVARSAKGQRTAALHLPTEDARVIEAAAEGFNTGAYKYTAYLTGSRKPKGGLRSAQLLVSDKKNAAFRTAAANGTSIATAIGMARDLVNMPPNDLNPITFADYAKEHAAKVGLECTIWNKKAIQKESMNLFLAVNSGSAIEPRMIHLVHKPKDVKTDKKIVFVGKGLTFDAGGLCIKPPGGMLDMKCDMAGGAATLGIMIAAAKLNIPVEVHGVIGCTENMTGAAAYRPGDVITSREGKTVEVINTDAEGRMVLADVLSWVKDTLKPDYMIDHATLTGACMVALGPWRSALYANNDELARLYKTAARDAGESFWQMPLDDNLRRMLKSRIADLKHTGERWGGSISAALFLREFIGKTKWIHLDIAGPAFLNSANGNLPKGGTGFGVATGVQFLRALAEADADTDDE